MVGGSPANATVIITYRPDRCYEFGGRRGKSVSQGAGNDRRMEGSREVCAASRRVELGPAAAANTAKGKSAVSPKAQGKVQRVSQVENSASVSSNGHVLDVALWVDAGMLRRERAFVAHLITGLRSEGQHVTLIAPQHLDLAGLPTLGSRLLTYRWNRWEKLALLQRMRLSPVVEELNARPPDVLVLWGSTGLAGSADPAALVLAQQKADIPAVVWCWDGAELFTPLVNAPQVKHVIASSQPIADRAPAGFRVPVTLIYPGVYCEDVPACYDVEGQVACLVSLDPLSSMPAYEALMRAARKVTDEGQEFLLFAYDQGRQEHPIWQLAQRLDLLDRVSFVPFQQDAEPLLLHGDLYLHVLPTNRSNRSSRCANCQIGCSCRPWSYATTRNSCPSSVTFRAARIALRTPACSTNGTSDTRHAT